MDSINHLACLQDDKQAILHVWQKHLQKFAYQTVGSLRITDIFDIVTSYPDSLEAVSDLEKCMAVCSLQKSLVKVYLDSCRTRLHIPGTGSLALVEENASRLARLASPTVSKSL